MVIQLSINNVKRAFALLEFLKASDFIDNFKIIENTMPPVSNAQPTVEPTFFDRFYGSLPNLDVPTFENYLTESRNEWDRPHFQIPTSSSIELRKARKIKLPDAIIAATAIVHDLILVSRNDKDFAAIPSLRYSNPFSGD